MPGRFGWGRSFGSLRVCPSMMSLLGWEADMPPCGEPAAGMLAGERRKSTRGGGLALHRGMRDSCANRRDGAKTLCARVTFPRARRRVIARIWICDFPPIYMRKGVNWLFSGNLRMHIPREQ